MTFSNEGWYASLMQVMPICSWGIKVIQVPGQTIYEDKQGTKSDPKSAKNASPPSN